MLEVVHEAEEHHASGPDPDVFVALDPGINVLAALTSNKPGFIPRLVSGKPLKAVNQLSHKLREHEQKRLVKGNESRYTSHREDSDDDEAQQASDALSAHS